MGIDPTADQASRLHLFSKMGQQCSFHAQAVCQFYLADFPCMLDFMQDENTGKAHSHVLGERSRQISMQVGQNHKEIFTLLFLWYVLFV